MSRAPNETLHRQVKALIALGRRECEIMRELNLSRGSARHYMHSPLSLPLPALAAATCRQVRQQHAMGHSDPSELAKRFGLGLDAVAAILARKPGTHGADSGEGDPPIRRRPRWTAGNGFGGLRHPLVGARRE